jgi:hypothetical protein
VGQKFLTQEAASDEQLDLIAAGTCGEAFAVVHCSVREDHVSRHASRAGLGRGLAENLPLATT